MIAHRLIDIVNHWQLLTRVLIELNLFTV